MLSLKTSYSTEKPEFSLYQCAVIFNFNLIEAINTSVTIFMNNINSKQRKFYNYNTFESAMTSFSTKGHYLFID